MMQQRKIRPQMVFLHLLAFIACTPATAFPREPGSSSDDAFVRGALRADLQQDDRAKDALKRIRVPAVRAVASMFLKDDSASERSLRKAVRASGLAPPNERTAPASSPPRSATAYLTQSVRRQRALLRSFQHEADKGEKTPLRAYAQKRLPLLQSDLLTAEREQRRIARDFSEPPQARLDRPQPKPSVTPHGLPPPTVAPEPEG